MRYREGVEPGTTAAAQSTYDNLLFAAVLGLAIGIVLTVAGVRGRQWWLVIWSGGLVLASVGYLGSIALGFW
ncbi:MAG: hypothetical protein KDG50_00845 [Chromatiales bacterium]|nr:hypothetical protein [Chromatiales bacterium]